MVSLSTIVFFYLCVLGAVVFFLHDLQTISKHITVTTPPLEDRIANFLRHLVGWLLFSIVAFFLFDKDNSAYTFGLVTWVIVFVLWVLLRAFVSSVLGNYGSAENFNKHTEKQKRERVEEREFLLNATPEQKKERKQKELDAMVASAEMHRDFLARLSRGKPIEPKSEQETRQETRTIGQPLKDDDEEIK